MTTALDTDALLALILDDAYTDESEKAIRQAYRDGLLAISPIVYAELAADGAFDSVAHLDQFLEDFSIQVDQP